MATMFLPARLIARRSAMYAVVLFNDQHDTDVKGDLATQDFAVD
jgi:hypothetical protein